MKYGIQLDSGNYIYNYKKALSQGVNCQLNVNKDINLPDLIESRKFLLENQEMFTCFHGDVTYNLAGSVSGTSDTQFDRKLNRCKSGLLYELDVGSFLNKGIVVHIGSCKEKDKGIHQIIDTINDVLITEGKSTINLAKTLNMGLLDFRNNRQIILENSAGLGNQIGQSLDEISYILSQINPTLIDNIKVCIDTCHIHDAGQYNFGSQEAVNNFYEDFNDKIGLNKLELFHLNDSKNKFGVKKDRHEHLTKGYIFGKYEDYDGTVGLKDLLQHSQTNGIPIISEFNDGNYTEDFNIIKELV